MADDEPSDDVEVVSTGVRIDRRPLAAILGAVLVGVVGYIVVQAATSSDEALPNPRRTTSSTTRAPTASQSPASDVVDGAQTVAAVMPDGTTFDLVGFDLGPLELDGFRADLLVEIPERSATPLDLGDIYVRPYDGAPEGLHLVRTTGRIDTAQIRAATTRWDLEVVIRVPTAEQLGPGWEPRIMESITLRGAPWIDLAVDEPLSISEPVALLDDLVVSTGCDSGEAAACSQFHGLQVTASEPLGSGRIRIESDAPRPSDDPDRITTPPFGTAFAHAVAPTDRGALLLGQSESAGNGDWAVIRGAILDIDNRAWTPIPTAPARTQLLPGRTTWTGSEIVVVSAAHTAFYDPRTERWRIGGPGFAVDTAAIVAWADTGYLWADDRFARWNGGDWIDMTGPFEDRVFDADRFRANLFAAADDGLVAVLGPISCGDRRFAVLEADAWRELDPLSLTTGSPDCSSAAQTGSAGGKIVAWSTNGSRAVVWNDTVSTWQEISAPSSITEGGGNVGVGLGEDLLMIDWNDALLSGGTFTWSDVGLPTERSGGYSIAAYEEWVFGYTDRQSPGGQIVDAWLWTRPD